MTPKMPAAPKKLPLGCWVVFGVCAFLLGVMVLGTVVIVSQWRGNDSHVPGTPTKGTFGGSDVVYRLPDGGTRCLPLTLVGEQQLPARNLWGPWDDENHGFALLLDPDGEYEIDYQTVDAGVTVKTEETGAWSIADGGLTLTPTGLRQRSVAGASAQLSRDGGAVEPVRAGRLDGVLLEYQPLGVEPKSTRHIDGVRLTGPAPPWYDSAGLDLVLHRGKTFD